MECFDRGARANDESCLYRIGMANLLGQLGCQQDYTKALPILQRAATLATISVPQPAYVYSLLLLGDLSSTSIPLPGPIPPHLLSPLIPPGSSAPLEARKHLERAAYLHFTPVSLFLPSRLTIPIANRFYRRPNTSSDMRTSLPSRRSPSTRCSVCNITRWQARQARLRRTSRFPSGSFVARMALEQAKVVESRGRVVSRRMKLWHTRSRRKLQREAYLQQSSRWGTTGK